MRSVNLDDFIISDLHLGHENIIKFCRPEFTGLEEMHEVIKENWNAVVGHNDRVIIAGDISMSKNYLYMLNDLNGEKILVQGNHDHENVKTYLPYFVDVRSMATVWLKKATEWKDGTHNGKQAIITHIPIHPNCMDRWEYNIHGHLHTHKIRNHNDWPGLFDAAPDARYINISCEQIGYTPIKIKDLFVLPEPERMLRLVE